MRIRRRPQLQPCPVTHPSSSTTTTTTTTRQAPPRGGGDEEEDGKKQRICVEGRGDADGTEGEEFVRLRHYDDLAVTEIQNECSFAIDPQPQPPSSHLHKETNLMMAAGPNHDDGITNIKVQQKQQEQGTQDRLFMVEGAHKNYSPAWCKNIQQGFHIGNKWDDEKNKSSSAGRETATASTATSGVINGDRHESQKSRKRRGNPAVLMEGSRCSRVNGRGWRCCQQTLVGYSLCEHHLGKGRLRSMTSAKSKGKKNKLEINSSSGCSSSHPSQVVAVVDDDNDQEGKNVGLRMKGGKKMGMVKAKSISSILLAQITEDEVLSTNGNESRCSSNSRSNLKIATT